MQVIQSLQLAVQTISVAHNRTRYEISAVEDGLTYHMSRGVQVDLEMNSYSKRSVGNLFELEMGTITRTRSNDRCGSVQICKYRCVALQQ